MIDGHTTTHLAGQPSPSHHAHEQYAFIALIAVETRRGLRESSQNPKP